MKQRFLSVIILTLLLFSTVIPGIAATSRRHRSAYRSSAQRSRYVRHRRHVKTAKRVGIGAVGGAAIGALAGGGKGAAIGAGAGAGAGYLYDRHKKHKGSY